MTSIAHFPFLSDAEFEQACSEIQAVSEYDTLKSPDLTLRLTRPLPAQHAICNPDGQAQDECSETLEEADEELLVVQSTTSSDALIYDIILSPSYRVPVVYIHTNFPLSNTKQLYDLIVPQSSRSAMEETGVLGALSLTDHPSTGLPVYFVHPCHTADAMKASFEGSEVKPLEYMMLWFGIIGTSVGINLPTEVALPGRVIPGAARDGETGLKS